MDWPKTILKEVFGLFVDDGVLAVSIVVLLAGMKLIALHLPAVARWNGFLLFGGLALVLAESSLRYARRSRR